LKRIGATCRMCKMHGSIQPSVCGLRLVNRVPEHLRSEKWIVDNGASLGVIENRAAHQLYGRRYILTSTQAHTLAREALKERSG
jgi:hypothetical protein